VPARQNLFPQDVGVSAVLRELADHVQIHPAQGERPAAIPGDDVVEAQLGCPRPRLLADASVGVAHRLDGVLRLQVE
jgi:hypothetical protein